MWVKWHLRKYIKLMSIKLANLRDSAMRESIKITMPGAYAIEYKTEYTEEAQRRYIAKANYLRDKFLRETKFIAQPPRPFPMSKAMCKKRIRQNRNNIKRFKETIDRHPFLMINGYSVKSLEPGDKVPYQDKQYKDLHIERNALLGIYTNDIPNKVPAYKKAVKQLIKEI